MFAAVVKWLSPVQKGQTLMALLILYVLCGFVAGYLSSRLYKYMAQKAWRLNIIMTATALPGFFVALFMILNVWLSMVGAATAVSFFTIVKLFLLWMCVSAPLVFVSGALGFRARKIEVPTKTNPIARIVPTRPFHVRSQCTVPMGGILPFGSACIELAFFWTSQLYKLIYCRENEVDEWRYKCKLLGIDDS